MKNILDEKNILINIKAKDKIDIINIMSKRLLTNGYIDNIEEFISSVLAREEVSPTGIEEGFSIPHGKSSSVLRNTFAIARLEEPILWETIGNKHIKIKLVVLIAVNDKLDKQGKEHLSLLSSLSQKLIGYGIVRRLEQAKSLEEFTAIILEEKKEEKFFKSDNSLNLVAVCACASGIAHTYMAKEAIIKAATSKGHSVKVECQGLNGIEDPLSDEDVANADFVILAVDVAISGRSRFKDLKKFKKDLGTAQVISSPMQIIEAIEKNILKSKE